MNRERIRGFVESRPFKLTVVTVIILNAIVIGIQTFPIPNELHVVLELFDNFCLLFYIVETILKIYALQKDYFKRPWNIFDLVIISLSCVPATVLPIPIQVARVLRVFRIGRAFRLVSILDQMRVIVEAIGKSIPGIAWTGFMLLVLMYVFDVAGISLFGEDFPEYFGNLSTGMFTLFQFATLEGWPDIAREVLAVYPAAWLYFIPYIVLTALIIMNVVVGIIVNTIEESTERARLDRTESFDTQLATELSRLKQQIETVECMLDEFERKNANEDNR